jgi:hypothetical protein
MAPARADAKASDLTTFLAYKLVDLGFAQSPAEASRAMPTASAIFLHSPDTILSIAAATFFETGFEPVTPERRAGIDHGKGPFGWSSLFHSRTMCQRCRHQNATVCRKQDGASLAAGAKIHPLSGRFDDCPCSPPPAGVQCLGED